MAELDQWINSAGEGGQRNSMQYLLSSGTQTSYEFNFAGGYIDAAHVKAYIYHSASGLTTDVPVTLSGPNTVELDAPVPVGDYLVVYRDTPKDLPMVDFVNGAVIDEENLDTVAQQAVFAAAEMVDRFSEIKTSSDDAIQRSYTALLTAQAAEDTAQGAHNAAADAVDAADNAVTIAGDAVTTANAATDTANAAVGIAEGAVTTANAASGTADDALGIATGIDSKAQEALDTSNTALDVANGVDGKATQALADAAEALGLVQDGQSASNISVVPAGGIASENVQDALVEIDEEKLSRAANLADLQSLPAALTALGLNNVDNTSDADKPMSAETAAAIDRIGLNEGGSNTDPNTTDRHVILSSHANTPSASFYWHIQTLFYSVKDGTANRAQIAFQYNAGNQTFARSCYNGTWTAWVRLDMERGPAGEIVLNTEHGNLVMGPLNTGLCHFNTDRPSFYFYKPISIAGNTAYHAGNLTYTTLAGKPSTFPPSSHTHTWAQISGKPATMPPGAVAFQGIGSYAIARKSNTDALEPGATLAGSSLARCALDGSIGGAALSGSWRLMSRQSAAVRHSLWHRYA